MSDKKQQKELTAKNIKAAIILGLIAFGLYAGFILMVWV